MTNFKIGDKVKSKVNNNFVGIVDSIDVSHIMTFINIRLNDAYMLDYCDPYNWELYFEVGDIVVYKESNKIYQIYNVYTGDNNWYNLERFTEYGRCTRFHILPDDIRLANNDEILEFHRLKELYEIKEKLDITPLKEDLNKVYSVHMNFAEFYPNLCERRPMPKFKQVIYNNPATIIFWEDGTKTVVKCEGEKYDELKGLMIGIVKKVCGLKNFYTYYDIITKYVTGKNILFNIEKGLAERYVMSIYHIKKINSKDDIYKVAMTDGFYISTERK